MLSKVSTVYCTAWSITRGAHDFPGAESLWGAKSLRGSPKNPHNITSTFFNSALLLLERPQVWTWWRQTCSLFRAPSNLGTPLCQRWHESLFQTPTPLLLQNFVITVRIRQVFKFENPTPAQTPATTINPILNYPCVYLRSDRTDSCYCRNLNVTPDPVFPKYWLRIRVRKKSAESCRSRLRCSGSGPTSALCTSETSGLSYLAIQIQSWFFKTQSRSNHTSKVLRNLKSKSK